MIVEKTFNENMEMQMVVKLFRCFCLLPQFKKRRTQRDGM